VSVPVIEHIAVYLNSLVNSITVANGYNYDLVAVRPRCLSPDEDLEKDKHVIISQGDAKRDPDPAQGACTWNQPFFLHAIAYEDTVESIDTKLNKIRCDIEKAIGVENAGRVNGKRCNGYAESIKIAEHIYLLHEQSAGIVVRIVIGYSVAEGDPYTVA